MKRDERDVVIKVDRLSKQYMRGVIGSKTVKEALSSKFSKLIRHSDPIAVIDSDIIQGPSAFFALKDVSFEIKRGDAFGIIGENGSGKSTLLKIISGITEPTNGTVSVTGSIASLLEVGVGFHPELTGRENVYLNGAILGLKEKEIDELFDQIVEFSEIGGFIDTPVKRYSSGMYVRLAFSVAAHLYSDIVILDEVLAVGDAQFQRKCMKKMESIIKDSQRTVLFVSHDASAVKRLCNKCVRLEQGKVIDCGLAAKVVTKYCREMSGILPGQSCYKRIFSPPNGEQKNRVRLISVFTADKEGKAIDSIDVNTDFLLAVEYEVLVEGAYAGFTFTLSDEDDKIVFSSINNLETEFYSKPMKKGIYFSFCHVPANFLNNISYRVSLNCFGKSYKDISTITDVLMICINDSMKLRGDYIHAFGGVLRPELKWRTIPARESVVGLLK